MNRFHRAMLAILAGCSPCFVGAATAQEDSVSVVAGARYEAGSMKRRMLGTDYRDLWTASLRVPLLRPDTFQGGLTLLQRGGGRQTASLRFRASDGREYVFRSVDKDQMGGLHPDLHGTIVGDVVQDQVSSKHPGAALVVAPLLRTAGVLHVSPRLAVMADHPLLGEFRSEFAGMLGMIEERPEEPEDGEGAEDRYGSFGRVIGSERLFERLEESPEDRVDAREFLKARLLDIFVGDWDRHSDQWRWAESERDDMRFWIPIPRDRDNAFSSFDGLIGTIGRIFRPNVIAFDYDYPDLIGLTYNAQPLDRRILPELSRAVWDSVAQDVLGRLSDRVIAGAVAALPPPYAATNGPDLESRLRYRRTLLGEVAANFYDLLASEVDVYGTDAPERAEVAFLPGGAVRIRVSASSGQGGPYFDRTFLPDETREVRLYLLGGDDRVQVSGTATGPVLVRIVGGGGDDAVELAEPDGARASITFYDRDGRNTVLPEAAIAVDRRRFDPGSADVIADTNPPPPRDWGTDTSLFSPTAGWESEIGPVLGLGPARTRYGFRRVPYAERASVTLSYAPVRNRAGVEAEIHTVHTGSQAESFLSAWATDIAVTRFHGFGNDSPEGPDPAAYRIWERRIGASFVLTRALRDDLRVSAGPVVEYLMPRAAVPAGVDPIRGSRDFGILGASAEALFDRRDSAAYPTRGFTLQGRASGAALAWGSLSDPFARGELTATAYVPLPLPLEPVVAGRVGGRGSTSKAPFQHAATLGGGSSLRGYRSDRFTGDSSIFGSAELRTRLGRTNLRLIRGELGLIALADAGRVTHDGVRPDQWHTAVGGGVWFGSFDQSRVGHLLVAKGEGWRVHVGFHAPF